MQGKCPLWGAAEMDTHTHSLSLSSWMKIDWSDRNDGFIFQQKSDDVLGYAWRLMHVFEDEQLLNAQS